MIIANKPLHITKAIQNSINKIKGVDIMNEIYEMFDIPEDLEWLYFDEPNPSTVKIPEIKKESNYEKVIKVIKQCKHKNPTILNYRGLLLEVCDKCKKEVGKMEIVDDII